MRAILNLGALLIIAGGLARHDVPPGDWRVTGGEPGNTRYSSLAQINRSNAAQLRVAWSYPPGNLSPDRPPEIHARPIIQFAEMNSDEPRMRMKAV